MPHPRDPGSPAPHRSGLGARRSGADAVRHRAPPGICAASRAHWRHRLLLIAQRADGNSARHLNNRERLSTPLNAALCTGTPNTGTRVFARTMPGRCAAPPAPAQSPDNRCFPRLPRQSKTAYRASGVWRPLQHGTGNVQGIRISAVNCMVAQSLWTPSRWRYALNYCGKTCVLKLLWVCFTLL